MSDLYDAEEADQEAAERLRVDEWAAEHQNPLTAALQRAEHAEERARLAEERLACAERSVEQIRDRTLREVELHGRFVYESEDVMDPVTCKPVVQVLARRRLVMDTDGGDC